MTPVFETRSYAGEFVFGLCIGHDRHQCLQGRGCVQRHCRLRAVHMSRRLTGGSREAPGSHWPDPRRGPIQSLYSPSPRDRESGPGWHAWLHPVGRPVRTFYHLPRAAGRVKTRSLTRVVPERETRDTLGEHLLKLMFCSQNFPNLRENHEGRSRASAAE